MSAGTKGWHRHGTCCILPPLRALLTSGHMATIYRTHLRTPQTALLPPAARRSAWHHQRNISIGGERAYGDGGGGAA
jgi:hypothetical protein